MTSPAGSLVSFEVKNEMSRSQCNVETVATTHKRSPEGAAMNVA